VLLGSFEPSTVARGEQFHRVGSRIVARMGVLCAGVAEAHRQQVGRSSRPWPAEQLALLGGGRPTTG